MLKWSLACLAVVALGYTFTPESAAQKNADPAAVGRARKTVKMLDDVYKTAIVLITDTYVHDKKSYPAGRAAVKWFESINKKGWHQVRIIDATGEPYNPANVAEDAFEKEAIAKLKAGDKYFERVAEGKDGKPVLRAATFIPVVLDKCVLCHDHYKNSQKGEAIGALMYTVPVE